MDGYRSQPPYPSSYDPSYHPRAYHPSSYHQEPYPHEPTQPESPSSSVAPSAQQPLHNALSNAFDKSDSARAVDPDLIAQITAEVKKSVLDEIKWNGMRAAGQPASPPLYPVQSPVLPTPLSPRNVYTPPSPKRADLSSHGSATPDSSVCAPLSDAADTPTARHRSTQPADMPREKTKTRLAHAARVSTEETYSPIEKMWQRLFEPGPQGQPTPRLGQFLRGLALHIIEDYEPKKSLVITPSKMLRFYNDVKLDQEIYPWSTIFGKLPYSNMSKVYREMRCQHHLIQDHNADQPYIPALTPEGFQEWMTAMIQAYPDTEYERLSRAVLDMPISNADDSRERFPKELPRRLFPLQGNLHAQQRCAAALSAEGVGPLRRAPTFPPPPPMGNGAGASTGLGQERSPYASQPETKAADSEDHHEPLSMPIERERKPYSAGPGGGKVYDDGHGWSLPSEPSMHEQRRRTHSTASQTQWTPPSNASYLPQNSHTGSQADRRRTRSPSLSSYEIRSDQSVRDASGSYHAYDSEEENRRFAKDAEIRRNEWAGRHANSDGGRKRRSTDSSYDSQPRSVYDEEYYCESGGSNGYGSKDIRGHDSRRH